MNFAVIDKIPRSAVAVLVGAGLVVTPLIALAHDDTVLAHNNTKNAVTTTTSVPAAQVAINAKGAVTVKGATVTSVNGSTIVATTQWGNNTLTWTITAASSTEFLYKGGRNAVHATVVAGDSINFSGALLGNGLMVAANVVRDNSKEKPASVVEKHTFVGKLASTIGTTSLPTTFMLNIGDMGYTVNVPAGTPILAKNWASINLGSFKVGDIIRVYGSAEASSTNTLDAVVVRDATR